MKIVILGAGQVGAASPEPGFKKTTSPSSIPMPHGWKSPGSPLTWWICAPWSATRRCCPVEGGIGDADMIIAADAKRPDNLVCNHGANVFNIAHADRPPGAFSLEMPNCCRRKRFAVGYALRPEQVITDYPPPDRVFPEVLQVLSTLPMGGSVLVAVRCLRRRAAGRQADQIRVA